MDRLTLTSRCAGRTVRQQVVDAEQFGVGVVGVQRVHQSRPFLDNPHSRMAMAVDPTLMPLGQPEPALQIEIVVDLIEGVTAGKEAGAEALHQPSHLGVDRVAVAVKAGETCKFPIRIPGMMNSSGISQKPTHGTLRQFNLTTFTYTAARGYQGSDTFAIYGTGKGPYGSGRSLITVNATIQ